MCSTDSVSMKTAATVLQELMMKRGRMPEYECVGQSGLNHQIVFEYRCSADGVSVRATARSKKDAKQAAAKRALAALAARGDNIPPPFNIPLEDYQADGDEGGVAAPGASGGSASYVALLKELCDQYSLAAPEYELVSDTGPPHQRRFTISAAVGKHKFLATANNKRSARQSAADLLYKYLRENLARLTDDFNEDEALVRAHEKAMERYVEVANSNWRPNLGQTIAEYHLGLRNSVTEEQRLAALAALDSGAYDCGLKQALAALNLEPTVEMMSSMMILSVPRANPPLTFASIPPRTPEADAADYLRLALTAAN